MAGYFFGCPHCRAKLETSDASRAGRTVTCPKCEQALIIPPPPKMGVSLSQDGDLFPTASAEEASQVVVSSDPGFKRPMSPAKAYSDTDVLPAASTAGFDRLPKPESLEAAQTHSIEASGDLEGYSFSLPETGTEAETPAPRIKKKKTPKDKIEPPTFWEEPKHQLLALVAIVAIIGGWTAWSRRFGTKDNAEMSEKEAIQEIKRKAREAEKNSPPAPTIPQPVQSGATAGPATPGSLPGLPGATALPGSVPAQDAGEAQPPGAVPNVLPESNGASLPGSVPRPLPESTPNVVVPESSEASPEAAETPQ